MDKGKGKEKMLDDDDPPSPNVLGETSETETEYERVVTPADYEDEEVDSWDWRDYSGVLGHVLDQMFQATCWAIAIVRAVQALLNIGVGIQGQQELSIQHIVNNVKFDPVKGINNIKTALGFMKTSGVCPISQCRHRGELVKRKCSHKEVNCYTVDSFTHLTEIEDVDLEEIVRRQPVVALIPFTQALVNYNINDNWLYQHDRTQDGPLPPPMHDILIVGYGNRNGRPYWIIQNSWGDQWGDGGFAYIRQPVRGRSLSQFAEVLYPNKRDYPKDPGPKDGA